MLVYEQIATDKMNNFVFLPEITDKNSSVEKVTLRWIVPNESVVKEGDVVMEMATNCNDSFPVLAHKAGTLVKFWDEDLVVEKTKYEEKKFRIADITKVCIGGIFDSYENYVSSCFKYKAKVDVDSFTNETTISWVYVAEPIINIPYITDIQFNSFSPLKLSKNNLSSKDVTLGTRRHRKEIIISDFLSKEIRFSFVFSERNSFIEFTYSQDTIKLKKNDSISFLFGNGNISDFKLLITPYKMSEKSNTRHFRCQLYAEDIENLTNSLISKWRISFADEQKPPITADIVPTKKTVDKKTFAILNGLFNVSVHLEQAKRTPLLIQDYTRYYIKVLKKEVPDYEHPTKKYRGYSPDSNAETFDSCYVYLMKDEANNYYKIGLSKTPEYRERTLQSEKPSIEMICHKKLPSRKMAEAFERALHIAFADKRIRGEWFDLDKNDVEQIVESLK